MQSLQSDKYSMAEKILRDVESVINRDEELKEFVIIPYSLNQNKSPVVHEEHNLGLELWCVKHVYSYAYQKVLEIRKLISKRKLLYEDYSNVDRLILGVLLINPDISTFWNMRREFVLDGVLQVDYELKISRIILSHKYKCNEAFAYRKWIISRIITGEQLDKVYLNDLLTAELNVCNMTAQKSPNNYHAWNHRIWCLENIFRIGGQEINETVLTSELNYTETWISKHISEHTGFHYRQYILNRIISNIELQLVDKYEMCFKEFCQIFHCTRPDYVLLDLFGPSAAKWCESRLRVFYKNLLVLIYDLSLNTSLTDLYMEHETLWYHRRYILHSLLALLFNYFDCSAKNTANLDLVCTKDPRECNVLDNILFKSPVTRQTLKESGEKFAKIFKSDENQVEKSKIYKILLNYEKTIVDKYAKLNNRQGYLVKRHEKWLIYILRLSDV